MRFNVLFGEAFPTEYEGYKLNTDFTVGVKLSVLQDDLSFSDEAKLIASMNLLYKDKVPPRKIAIDGLIWFLSCGREIERDESACREKCLDFEVDMWDIYGAVFVQTGISLENVKMHWFKFMSIISNLNDCPLTQKISYRAVDLNKLSKSTRKYYAELKEKYRIKKKLTDEETEKIKKDIEDSHNRLRESGDTYMLKLMGVAP